jgi:hypothetical protein
MGYEFLYRASPLRSRHTLSVEFAQAEEIQTSRPRIAQVLVIHCIEGVFEQSVAAPVLPFAPFLATDDVCGSWFHGRALQRRLTRGLCFLPPSPC